MAQLSAMMHKLYDSFNTFLYEYNNEIGFILLIHIYKNIWVHRLMVYIFATAKKYINTSVMYLHLLSSLDLLLQDKMVSMILKKKSMIFQNLSLLMFKLGSSIFLSLYAVHEKIQIFQSWAYDFIWEKNLPSFNNARVNKNKKKDIWILLSVLPFSIMSSLYWNMSDSYQKRKLTFELHDTDTLHWERE